MRGFKSLILWGSKVSSSGVNIGEWLSVSANMCGWEVECKMKGRISSMVEGVAMVEGVMSCVKNLCLTRCLQVVLVWPQPLRFAEADPGEHQGVAGAHLPAAVRTPHSARRGAGETEVRTGQHGVGSIWKWVVSYMDMEVRPEHRVGSIWIY